ncbi:MAG: phosphatidylglycerophosphatase A, partial [Candidatus Marinimicrobia bacterium]|nr:phosphatidylglycerophosphatase A [Candidatus Neomarinimicrobiota bacterium]
GLLRPAPGTWGSLGGAVVWWLLWPQPVGVQVMMVIVAAGLGIWAGGYLERSTGISDPSIIVLDEVAGIWLALLGCGPVLWQFAVAFILFRLLDILKPGPIGRAQSLPGGWGIMADDLLAGGITLAVLVVLRMVL